MSAAGEGADGDEGNSWGYRGSGGRGRLTTQCPYGLNNVTGWGLGVKRGRLMGVAVCVCGGGEVVGGVNL